jgi:hypothetical protein
VKLLLMTSLVSFAAFAAEHRCAALAEDGSVIVELPWDGSSGATCRAKVRAEVQKRCGAEPTLRYQFRHQETARPTPASVTCRRQKASPNVACFVGCSDAQKACHASCGTRDKPCNQGCLTTVKACNARCGAP